MLLEKRERRRQRPVRLRLRVGLAAVAREGMIGTGIFVPDYTIETIGLFGPEGNDPTPGPTIRGRTTS
jgi:hypothetical protein